MNPFESARAGAAKLREDLDARGVDLSLGGYAHEDTQQRAIEKKSLLNRSSRRLWVGLNGVRILTLPSLLARSQHPQRCL